MKINFSNISILYILRGHFQVGQVGQETEYYSVTFSRISVFHHGKMSIFQGCMDLDKKVNY